MERFTSKSGSKIVFDMIGTIQQNKDYLGEIDGAIGDGDHGINMNKGFTMCENELKLVSGDLAFCLKTLSMILMSDIGGSMGPLYGVFFKSMAKACKDKEIIDAFVFGDMLKAGEEGVKSIGNADVGDKTMLDALVPAVDTYNRQIQNHKCFVEALEAMKEAALKGRDSTREMAARVGRASRLGERSRGVLDAGAVSCCLILHSMADSIRSLLKDH